MEKKHLYELRLNAAQVRKGIVDAVYAAQSGHPGGSLSIADTLTYLYFDVMNIFPERPCDEKRDRFVLSKGHAAPGLYAVMAQRGYFPKEELLTLRKADSRLQGHPSMNKLPGIDMSTGSLGQGISTACGMALSAKASGEDWRVYAILGDGELAEGMVWEAAMFAGHYKLDNLCAVVDNNGLQIDGRVEDVMSSYPIGEKFAAFGWNVIDNVDAHDFLALESAFNHAKQCKGKPSVIIQKSVKGKGVSFMENLAGWHGKAPNAEQYAQASEEIGRQIAEAELACKEVAE
jgi:transketolase